MMKFLGKRKFIIAVLLTAIMMFGGITVHADSWPEPEPFEIWSDDGTMVFRWNPGSEDNWLWGTAQAGVYRNDELIYSVENLPILGGNAFEYLLSTDFSYFVFRPQASQVVALGFFENGVLLRNYRIDELVRDMNVVTYSVNTASWENWSGRNFDTTNNTLTIVTRDNITYVFDITTGKIIYDTIGDTPFIPPTENSFGYFMNEGTLPLWAQESIERAGELGLLPTTPFVLDSEETPQEPNLPPSSYMSISENQSQGEEHLPTSTWRNPLIWGLFLALAITALTLILRSRANKRQTL